MEGNGEDSEDLVTIQEALRAEDILEEETAAVLGDVDDNECTYAEGYINRQALYACYTCTANKDVLAGVCYACSVHCHDGHVLYELYTKRNFRCDCGNALFPSTKCQLQSDKEELNSKNVYNDNFKGLYCTCKRPYPDEECPLREEAEMIQCILCEDWFHSTHLGKQVPEGNEFSEMVCDACVKKNSFLYSYYPAHDVTYVASGDTKSLSTPIKDVPGIEANNVNELIDKSVKLERSTSDIDDTTNDDGNIVVDIDGNENVISLKRKADDEVSDRANKVVASSVCKLKQLQNPQESNMTAMYLRENWRSEICTCTDCMAIYKSHGVSFLLDPQDSIHVYEERSKAKYESQRHAKINELESQFDKLPHDQRCQLAYGFNDLKTSLSTFFNSLASKKKVVEASDVHEFFQKLKQEKQDWNHMQY